MVAVPAVTAPVFFTKVAPVPLKFRLPLRVPPEPAKLCVSELKFMGEERVPPDKIIPCELAFKLTAAPLKVPLDKVNVLPVPVIFSVILVPKFIKGCPVRDSLKFPPKVMVFPDAALHVWT